jgi:hypothetical protein
MFSMLFAIIGDAFYAIKEGFKDTPTLIADLKKLMADSAQSVAGFKKSVPKRQTRALVERCGPFSQVLGVTFVRVYGF